MIVNILSQGLIYSILAMGVMLSYEILDLPDLSVDGTFPLGGVVVSVLLLKGVNLPVALLIANAFGFFAGAISGFLHVRLNITSLLSGILVMTGLYSINLMIASGSSNIPLFEVDTFLNAKNSLLYIFLIVLIVKFILDYLLESSFGYLMKVLGDNESMIANLGHNSDLLKVLALGISNSLVAFSGALMVVWSSFYDISMGTGMMVLGLSSVIIGSSIAPRKLFRPSTKVIMGAIVYQAVIAFALNLGMKAYHLKLLTVIVFLITLTLKSRFNLLKNGGK